MAPAWIGLRFALCYLAERKLTGAAMAKAGDIKRNMVVEHENQVYIVRDVSRSAPTARGGNTLFRLRLQAIPGGQRRELTLKADESRSEERRVGKEGRERW